MADLLNAYVAPADGPRLAYSQVGSGPDVVLLHGALVSREDMVLALFERLGERFRLTAMDRPGHGQSERAGFTGSPWRQAEAVHAACQALGVARPVMLGHSFGGAVALAYALRFPQALAGVVALSPIVFPEPRLEHLLFAPRAWPGLGPAANRAMVGPGLDPVLLPILWRAMFVPQEIPARFKELFPFERAAEPSRTEADGEDAVLLNVGLLRSMASYPFCRTPVRILGGGRDMVVNNALHGRLLARIMPGAEYEELPELGHMIHHFAQGRIAELVEALTTR